MAFSLALFEFVLINLFVFTLSQTNTTQTTQTTQTTTTTVTTTTTSAANITTPTVQLVEVPSNQDIGTCTCDLTVLQCDTNCCCDVDCLTTDQPTFTTCTNATNRIRPWSCYVDESESGAQVTGLFCITFDNYKKRNYYVSPKIITNSSDLEQSINNLRRRTDSETAQTGQSAAFYKESDPLEIISAQNVAAKWTFPISIFGDQCEGVMNIGYLRDFSSTCYRSITTVKDDCIQNTFLNIANYGNFKFRKGADLNPSTTTSAPSTSNATTTTAAPTQSPTALVPVVLMSCTSPTSCVIVSSDSTTSPIPTPVYNPTTQQCVNVVQSVHYVVVHAGSNGIQSVTAQALLANMASPTWQQSWSVEFRTATDSANPYERSGNPGYVAGEPLVAGIMKAISVNVKGRLEPRQFVELLADRWNRLTIPRANADNSCSGDRSPVTFGDDVVSDCVLSVDSSTAGDMCPYLQSKVVSTLLGAYQPSHVATLGNTSPYQAGDWVPIVKQTTPDGSQTTTQKGACSNFVTSLRIVFIYAYVGSLANPQPRIIAAAAFWGTSQTVRVECGGASCQPSSSSSTAFRVPIRATVQFIDGSTPAQAIIADPPKVKNKLPYDFFHPFYNGASSPLRGDGGVAWRQLVLFTVALLTL